MFSKLLVKLVDQAIVPALLLLVARLGSVFLVATYFNLPFNLGPQGIVFTHVEDYIMVNSYSILIMQGFLVLGISYILMKALAFHDTHVSPVMTARLFSLRLSSLIQTTLEIYSQGFVWLSYLYLMFFITGGMAIFGFVYAWVFFISLVLVLVSSVLVIFDIEQEVALRKEKTEASEESDYILKFNV